MCIYKKGLLDISQEIIVETIHCVEDFECLANERFVCREATVESSIEGKRGTFLVVEIDHIDS